MGVVHITWQGKHLKFVTDKVPDTGLKERFRIEDFDNNEKVKEDERKRSTAEATNHEDCI